MDVRHREASDSLTHLLVWHNGAWNRPTERRRHAEVDPTTVHPVYRNVQHHRSALADCLADPLPDQHRIRSRSRSAACRRRHVRRRHALVDYRHLTRDDAHRARLRSPNPDRDAHPDHQTKIRLGAGVGFGRRTCRTMLRPTNLRSAESRNAQSHHPHSRNIHGHAHQPVSRPENDKERRTPKGGALCSNKFRRRPTLPGHLYPSTIGADRLNFRVRDGNGCDPVAMVTGNQLSKGLHPRTPEQARAIVKFKPSAD